MPGLANFHAFIYLTDEHLLTQTDQTVYFFSMYRKDQAGAIALFQCVHQHRSEWVSPPRAPFGGIQCCTSCQPDELLFFISCIKTFVAGKAGKTLTVKTHPACYNVLQHKLLDSCYIQSEFSKIEINLNNSIAVGSGSFVQHIEPAERRRLQKCKTAGFTEGPDAGITPREAYLFLVKCREQSKYDMPLTFDQLNVLFSKFPDRFQCFSVYDAGQIIALTITVRVTDTILYNFLMADRMEYRKFSPVVLLIESVYNYCRREKILMIDLGISLDENGRHKPSLARFKKNIGGEISEKVTYRCTF